MKIKLFIIFVVGTIVIIGGLGYFINKPKKGPSNLAPFAQCLKDSGAVFYGAFWCPHCQEQKALFGSSKDLLPYVECSNTDNTQTQICKDKKIEGYPTWIFKDGSQVSGKMELATLAEKTQCLLPQ